MDFTIADILKAHRAGHRLAETIREVYARIASHADPALFITLRKEGLVLAEAARLQASGPAGLALYGVPFVVKDNIDVAGLPTSAACPAFSYMPTHSAFAVARLEAAGAIVIGKTNLDQFATGLVGVRSPHGTPRNCLRADLVPGGSSSGSATAVGAGIVPFALGTDTAGSGRVPAALNGIVGLKPSLGALSAGGVVPACRTLDTISIFALDVADAFDVFAIASGYDAADAYSKRLPAPRLSAMPPNLRVGVPRADHLVFSGDKLAAEAFAGDIARLKAQGASLVEIDMEPFFAVARLLYDGPWVAERYAAIRQVIETTPEALHPVTRSIIGGALKHTAVSTFEAMYRLAELRRSSEPTWHRIDMLAVPTIPTVFTLAEVAAEPVLRNSILGTYTNFVNLLDLAAIACPAGLRADGLPSSLTFIGPSASDGLLAGIAAQVQFGSAVPMGATGRAPAPPVADPQRAAAGLIEIAVVGAHLSGLPLNRELTALGGTFVRAAETASHYALYALPGAVPPKPGLVRVAAGTGAAISIEIWALDAAGFGRFVAGIPAPLGIGTLACADGSTVHGFLCEAEAVKGAKDISRFGGWRAYVAALAGGAA